MPPYLSADASWPPGSRAPHVRVQQALRRPNATRSGSESLAQFVSRCYGRRVTVPWLRSYALYEWGVPPHSLDAAATVAAWVAREHKRGARRHLEAKLQAGYRSGPRVVSGGMGQFLGAVTRALPQRIHCDTRVERLQRERGGTWSAHTGTGEVFRAASIALATNAHDQARLIGESDPTATDMLCAFPYHAVTSCCVRLNAEDTAALPIGLGVWCGAVPRTRIAGIRFDHAIDPSLAPKGLGLLSVRLLGVPPPPTDDALKNAVLHELRAMFRRRLRPIGMSLHRDKRAIPHVAPGHQERMRSMAARLEARGITLRGRHISGMAIEDRVRIDAPLRTQLPEGVTRV